MAALVLCEWAPGGQAAWLDRVRPLLLQGRAELLFLGAEAAGGGGVAGLRFASLEAAKGFAGVAAGPLCRVLRLAAPGLGEGPTSFP
ncbi:hypothetical protein JMJ56_13120 [Belnapia sp. T18]|uniref:Uncharacterized protein n=1 Tax=Belnapia arida TaxID=2804533 RepID=A0ABS1U2S1_9PROT|nr:hypothetical protein [Belnapia arida]MBL6078953.1 hypothetical protein [Belnapia arida]